MKDRLSGRWKRRKSVESRRYRKWDENDTFNVVVFVDTFMFSLFFDPFIQLNFHISQTYLVSPCVHQFVLIENTFSSFFDIFIVPLTTLVSWCVWVTDWGQCNWNVEIIFDWIYRQISRSPQWYRKASISLLFKHFTDHINYLRFDTAMLCLSYQSGACAHENHCQSG